MRIFIYFGCCLCLLANSCNPGVEKNSTENSKTVDPGSQLARKYCSGCHLFPEPQLLPKSIWERKVLPNMATRMGLPVGFPYEGLDHLDVQVVIDAKVIPDQPMLSMNEMAAIVKFYQDSAPAQHIIQHRDQEPTLHSGLFKSSKLFKEHIIDKNLLIQPFPDSNKVLFSFEGKGTWLYDFKTETNNLFCNCNAVDAGFDRDFIYLLDIHATKAYNRPLGKIWAYSRLDPLQPPSQLIDSLIRPVDFDLNDVNQDGKVDFLVCEFGDYLGCLSLFVSNGENYHRQILDQFPGATKAYFIDLDHQGSIDVIALMAQGNERIITFLNVVTDKPIKQLIVQFPPSFGLNSFELTDLDQDNDLDLLLTNGDNADMSSSLKSYHGLRIYEQEPQGKFRQTWFYPVHGASKSLAEDFDGDGDKDLALIAHFPDFKQAPHEQFIYFENRINQFIPYYLPSLLNGRLLTINVIDANQDGRKDLLLGNYTNLLTDPGPETRNAWNKNPQDIWLLTNQVK